MNKDVIYIDVEDDVTAIIGKIKASHEKIIALVPPKRAGILQSAVNLRLLDRMANSSHKNLVLITNNQALIALSAAAGIPVAKNLQSKPELAEISALNIDDEDDVIDGSSLPIGELQKTSDRPKADPVDDAIDELDIDDKKVDVASGMGAVSIKQPKKLRNDVKVPNFNSFRKRLFVGIAAFIALVVFLVWANIFAPSAKVIVTAKTIPTTVNQTVTLAGTAATDVSKGTIQSSISQLKKDVSVDFDATGSKLVGDKATGSVVFRNCDTSKQEVIKSGTYISANGKNYVVQIDTTVGPGSFSGGGCSAAGTSVASNVVATDVGADYNADPNTQFLVAGYTSQMTAKTTAGLSGGTSHQAKVVSALDIQKATDTLTQLNSDDVKAQLVKLFVNGEVVIDDSFTVERAAPVSVPAVDAEASTGKAKLTSSTTYTITAIAKPDLEIYLKDNINKQIGDNKNQRIYDDGIDKVKLFGFLKTGAATTVKIISTGQVGPKIDEAAIKDQVKGKKAGEAQLILGAIAGVDNVNVQFSYFWVNTIPGNVDKITIEFKLQNG